MYWVFACCALGECSLQIWVLNRRCMHQWFWFYWRCYLNDPWWKVVLKQLFAKKLFQNNLFKTLEKLPWKRDNKKLYIATCSQLSYYLVTVVQICSSFVYRLSILMIETEFIVLALKKRAYLRVIISLVQLSFPLLSLCQVFVPWLIVCAIHITAHFTAQEAQILIFWRMCSIFFVIKKRADFCFSILNFCRGREPGLWRFLYLPDIYADFPCAKFWFNQLLIRHYFIVSFSQSVVLKQLFSLWRINRNLCCPISCLLWNISIEAIVA